MASSICVLSDRSESTDLGWRTFLYRFEKPLTGLLLTLALAVTAATTPQVAHAAKVKLTASSLNASNTSDINTQPETEDVYLYGQAPTAGQIGAAYMVFEVNGQDVSGGIYMPYSSFDCFQGEVEANQLQLTITNSYEETAYPYSVALAPNSASASANGPAIAPFGLVGYHAIPAISAVAQEVLSTCRAQQI